MNNLNLLLGIDNVFIERLVGKEDKFAKRILSEKEYSEYLNSLNKTECIASHFATKEAFIKATKNKELNLKDIELLHDKNNCPHLFYKGVECGIISVTHDIVCTVIVILNCNINLL